ncbi:MAG: chemotaxis protein CheW [Desulfobacterium sp.]|nr:chemotaxis protein CheW [Desulfobacterium sp.]
MTQEQLFASFILDENQGMEIALKAEHVTEATPINGVIQKLPGGHDYLEGVMSLRDAVIPVINLKRRFGLSEHGYGADARIAVVSILNRNYGLMFDDIKEVFRADATHISPICKAVQAEDHIISGLIQLESGKRIVELLDLNYLFRDGLGGLDEQICDAQLLSKTVKPSASACYVVFQSSGQAYGVPVHCAQEITFLSDIDEMFRTGIVAGTLGIRGKTIPVLNARTLLSGDTNAQFSRDDETRVLVLASEECCFGMIVDGVKDIVTIFDDEILRFPEGKDENVLGMYQRPDAENVILLNMQNLVCIHLENIKSIARLGNEDGYGEKSEISAQPGAQHLITENCYLIFSIGKQFAIELKDVQEIIENVDTMAIPAGTGYCSGVINLRGLVVPVVNLKKFYNYPVHKEDEAHHLIICCSHGQTVALEVDHIVTIHKQEQYYATPSLAAQLSDKKDTADRLIEYLNPEGIREHVLVINTHNLIRNHLKSNSPGDPS